ncbi:hypothetical protein DFH06DRAFT_1150728 [Mycena polygramma]|nr:hypothetical protein DFH06DRAFT_1150728 [Mycena polygramma]
MDPFLLNADSDSIQSMSWSNWRNMSTCRRIVLVFLYTVAFAVALGFAVAVYIVHNILGHAIFAIARPDIYLPTLRSVVFSSLYGGLIIISPVLLLAAAIVAFVTAGWKLKLFGLLCCISIGVVINVVGVEVLKYRGHEGLPTLKEAACVAAVGQAVIVVINFYKVFL